MAVGEVVEGMVEGVDLEAAEVEDSEADEGEVDGRSTSSQSLI